MNSDDSKAKAGLSMDRAAFILIRVKRVFRKKKQQLKEKALASDVKSPTATKHPPPLLRSRTLPSIVVPGLSILQAQIEARYKADGSDQPSGGLLQPPRVAFSDDTLQGHRHLAFHRLSSPEHTSTMVDVMRSLQQSNNKASRCPNHSSLSSTALNRLAKLLSQKGANLEAPESDAVFRRLSWDRRDGALNSINRSSSIDSMVEGSWPRSDPPTRRIPSPLLAAGGSSSSSPSLNRRMKGSRVVPVPAHPAAPTRDGFPPAPGFEPASLHTQAGDRGMDFWVDNFKIAARKKLDKINKINIHLQALFAALEHNQVDKVRTILESTDVDVNATNADFLTPLDVAVLTNSKPMTKLVMSWGGRHGTYFESPEKLCGHLRAISQEAELRLSELLPPRESSTHNKGGLNYQPPTITSCHGNEKDKEVLYWERRASVLKKMLLAFQQARPPDVPSLALADVIGVTQVLVRFQVPDLQESALCTKVKVQWSDNERFEGLAGVVEIQDISNQEYSVNRLEHGRRYWFRISCGNARGFGHWRPTTPPSVVPSSWRDAGSTEAMRVNVILQDLEDLFLDVRQVKPDFASEIKDFPEIERPGETPALGRRNVKKKTTIKQLFTATGKFHKNLKRGVFLSCLVYHDDKILVTNEDFLPTVEVDETYPSSFYHDFHWFMKIATTWDDVKCLRVDMERHLTSTTSHFRIKLLQAAQQLQSALNTNDLGQLHYLPIRDEQGTLVFTIVNKVPSFKSVSVLNLRWMPLSKLLKKLGPLDESSVGDLLMSSIPCQISYHEASNKKLPRGLYLGYLKMQSSVDLIHVIVSHMFPNVLPYCKVRDNPHISLEEWEWLKRINSRHKSLDGMQGKDRTFREMSDQQIMFLELIANTTRKLFSCMKVPSDEEMCHRIYDLEVIELGPEVSVLVVIPPIESSCGVPGQEDGLLQRGEFLGLPVQVLEMIHLNTYQPDVIARYSRLSCIIELYLTLAQHSQREAFSTAEVETAKDRLQKLQDLQQQLNQIWKSVRWIMSVIAFARDRSLSTSGISVSHLLALTRKKSKCSNESHGVMKRSLLQLPDSPVDPKLARANMSRGSWSGRIGVEASSIENLSRSEQRLDLICKSSEWTPAVNCIGNRLPSSRSEDHLLVNLPNPRPSTTSVSATNSPLLPPRHLGNSAHNSDSLRSVSSDESTAAVVSLPVTTPLRGANSSPGSPLHSFAPPLRAGSFPDPAFSPSMRPSSSLLSLAKPALTESRRASLLLGNAIPVNISSRSPVLNCSLLMPTMTKFPPKIPTEDLEEDTVDVAEGVKVPTPGPGVLRVYAAYDTGLANGTSLQLHVTPRTSAREVVDLVVRQLNMAVLLKGRERPIYGPEQLSNFCLVAVIGARERCLRDDFKPLQLQNPWKKGRLYVRLKNDVLAALEHSSRQTAFL